MHMTKYRFSEQSLQPLINFIYSVADQVLINTYEPSKYKDVILPMTVIRRLDAVLEPTKDKVLETHEKYKDKLNDLTALLTSKQNGSGQAFYNTSPYSWHSFNPARGIAWQITHYLVNNKFYRSYSAIVSQ